MQWKQVSSRFGQSIVNLYKSNRQLGFSNYPLLTKTTKIAAIANAMKDAPTATSMLDPAVPVLFVLVELWAPVEVPKRSWRKFDIWLTISLTFSLMLPTISVKTEVWESSAGVFGIFRNSLVHSFSATDSSESTFVSGWRTTAEITALINHSHYETNP